MLITFHKKMLAYHLKAATKLLIIFVFKKDILQVRYKNVLQEHSKMTLEK